MKVELKKSSSKRSWGYQGAGQPRPNEHSIVYVNVVGETLFENLVNRHHRPYKALRPIVIEELTRAGIPFKSIRWSQKAGCSCPCSPGFIIQGGDIGNDYSLTIMDGNDK